MGQIIRLVVLPNLRSALVGSLLLTLAVVMGEFTFANVLLFHTFAVLINEVGQNAPTEAAALSTVSFLITWGGDAGRAGGRARQRPSWAEDADDGDGRSARRQQDPTPGATVLAQLDLDMGDGELVCLLGPSGCGKTTLLRIIAGFITPDTGTVVVGGHGRDRAAAERAADGHGVPGLQPVPEHDRAATTCASARASPACASAEQMRARRRPAGAGRPRRSHTDKYPHQLSGGQQQRVALARALAVQPQVLLLDEPLSALDAKVRAQLRDEIRRIQRETGVTTVLVTHDQEEALSISDRVAVMNEGRLLQVGAPVGDLSRAGGRVRRALHRRGGGVARRRRGRARCASAGSSCRRTRARRHAPGTGSTCSSGPSTCGWRR